MIEGQQRSFEEAFFVLTAWYNGEGEEIDELIEWIEYEDMRRRGEFATVPLYKAKKRFENIHTLIGCLVLMFGNYGTSPRGGWLEDAEGAVQWLKEMRKYWDEESCY